MRCTWCVASIVMRWGLPATSSLCPRLWARCPQTPSADGTPGPAEPCPIPGTQSYTQAHTHTHKTSQFNLEFTTMTISLQGPLQLVPGWQEAILQRAGAGPFCTDLTAMADQSLEAVLRVQIPPLHKAVLGAKHTHTHKSMYHQISIIYRCAYIQ